MTALQKYIKPGVESSALYKRLPVQMRYTEQ